MKAGKPVTILAIGDSITCAIHYVGTGEDERLEEIHLSYTEFLQEQLREKFNNPKIKIETLGINGSTAKQALPELKKRLEVNNYGLVIVQFGHNERHRQVPTSEYTGSIKEMIDRARKIGTEVLLLTPNFTQSEWKNERNRPYIKALKKLAKKEKVGVVDLYKAFVKTDRTVKEFFYSREEVGWFDSTHPNPEGHRLIGKAIRDYLVKQT